MHEWLSGGQATRTAGGAGIDVGGARRLRRSRVQRAAILGCRSLLGGREGCVANPRTIPFTVADNGAAAFGGEDTPHRGVVSGGDERSVGVQGTGPTQDVYGVASQDNVGRN